MIRSRSRAIQAALVAAASVLPVASQADVLYLRASSSLCSGLSPCVTTMSQAMSHIASNPPSASAPLTVDIGAGSFDGFACSSKSHIQLRGAGRTQTTIDGVAAGTCESLEFRDLRVESDSTHAVLWFGSGSSTWMQVDIVASPGGALAAWYDQCGFIGQPVDPGEPLSSHSFFDVHFDGGTGFFAQCGESWLWGSDVLGRIVGVDVSLRGDVRIFGSSVRVVADDSDALGVAGVRVGRNNNNSSNPEPPAVPVVTTGKGMFHMHGGIVSVDAMGLEEFTGDVVGLDLQAGESAMAHTPDTAFALRAPEDATPIRVRGAAESPFLWAAATTPPTSGSEANRLESEDGQDLFVETDCGSDGDCANGGSEAHLMIHNPAACPSEGWLDVVTGRCRNDTP